MTQLNSSIIAPIFPLTSANEWDEGLEIFDDGCISQMSQHDTLFSAQINSRTDDTNYKVSLKLHPSKTSLMWSECSCPLQPKDKRSPNYCSHIISFLLSLIFTQRKEKIDEQLSEDIAQSFLLAFDHGIDKVTYDSSNAFFKITVTLQKKRKITFCVPTGTLMKCYNNNLFHPKLNKLLNKEEIESTFGLKVTSDAQDIFTVEKAIKIPTNSVLKSPKNKVSINEFCNGKKDLGLEYNLVSLNKAHPDLLSNKVYIPKCGIISIVNKESIKKLNSWPEKTKLQEDKAALFFKENNLKEYCKSNFLWTNQTSIKSFAVESCAEVKQINIIGEENNFYLIDIDLHGKSYSSSLQKIIGTDNRFYKNGQNSWLELPSWIHELQWRVNSQGQILVNILDILKIKSLLKTVNFVGKKESVNKIKEQLKTSGTLNPPPSLDFSPIDLRPYQQEGYNWLWWLYQNKLHGLLADDMGLGKTHQTLALFSGIYSDNRDKQIKHLVVCPSTVLEHWQDKLDNYSPYLNAFIYHGYSRHELQERISNSNCVVLTTYGIIMRDLEFLSQIPWKTLVLDEAHFVKNDKTAAYKSVCSLKSEFRLCLTGTPLENNLSELKTLFDFILPGYLGTRKNFREKFLQPIESACKIRETDLKRTIAPFKMRRTKKQVLQDLPEKVEDIRFCTLSDEQKTLYQQILEQKGQPLVEKIKSAKDSEPLPSMHILSIIQTLKQLTDHPALVKKDKNYKKYTSGKFELLKQILDEAINSNNKIVIFSQFLGMIDIIERHCQEKNFGVVTLTGSTTNRGQVIKQFQTDPNTNIFVGSLLAGGMGIDLTAASIVIHYDRWWNPSKENQATDRAHRIGQKNCVQVFKLITRNSLEENIDKLIAKKSDLFSRFLESDKKQISWLSKEDILEILDKSKIN
jgi:SNF2 family DNA or RNA helicase